MYICAHTHYIQYTCKNITTYFEETMGAWVEEIKTGAARNFAAHPCTALAHALASHFQIFQSMQRT